MLQPAVERPDGAVGGEGDEGERRERSRGPVSPAAAGASVGRSVRGASTALGRARPGPFRTVRCNGLRLCRHAARGEALCAAKNKWILHHALYPLNRGPAAELQAEEADRRRDADERDEPVREVNHGLLNVFAGIVLEQRNRTSVLLTLARIVCTVDYFCTCLSS